jgi:glycosyltransferase involved in cell wall biosynthesis
MKRTNSTQELKNLIREKDARIKHLEVALEEKDSRITDLQKELDNIYSSRGWRALLVYYKVRDTIFSADSYRRRAKSFLNFLREIRVKQLRLLTKDNLQKSLFYIRSYGVTAFLRKVIGKLNSEKVYYSHKPNVPVLKLSAIEEEQVLPFEDAKISVVIPVKNAGGDFDLLLSTLREQQGIKDIEIIVVDSGSSDETVEIARKYGARIIEIAAEEFSHSHARNTGAENASGNYIFFTVQDALPPSRLFLYELFGVLRNNDIVAVSCAEFPREDADLFYCVLLWNHYRFLEVDRNDRILSMPETLSHISLRKNGQLSDLACLIQKEVFMKYGYQRDYAEDLDLGVRLIRDGHKLAFMDSIKIIHSHNRPPSYFLKRAYADNLFLTDIFPDYPVPSVEGHRLFKDIILTQHSIYALINEDLGCIKTPLDVQELFEVVAARLRPFDYQKDILPWDYCDLPQMDEGFRSFLREISEKCHLPAGESPYDGILIFALLNHLDLAKEYMASSYNIVDNTILEDFKLLLMKTFALQCGAHLAYCHLNNDPAVRELHEGLRAGI